MNVKEIKYSFSTLLVRCVEKEMNCKSHKILLWKIKFYSASFFLQFNIYFYCTCIYSNFSRTWWTVFSHPYLPEVVYQTANNKMSRFYYFSTFAQLERSFCGHPSIQALVLHFFSAFYFTFIFLDFPTREHRNKWILRFGMATKEKRNVLSPWQCLIAVVYKLLILAFPYCFLAHGRDDSLSSALLFFIASSVSIMKT